MVGWLLMYKTSHPYTDADLKEEVSKARQDSVNRSRSVVSGKVQEHLAPLFPGFCAEFNMRDARFLGAPLDFIVFDGLDSVSEGGEVRRVVFVEVKTGKANLSTPERHIRNAIEAGNVEFRLLRLPGASETTSGKAALDGSPAPPALQS